MFRMQPQDIALLPDIGDLCNTHSRGIEDSALSAAASNS